MLGLLHDVAGPDTFLAFRDSLLTWESKRAGYEELMRALNFVDRGRLEWREAPEPELQGDREALVRPVVVAICDLDAGIVSGRVPLSGPFPVGHEGVAEIIDVGDDVSDFQPGQLVSIPFQLSCGACRQCRLGRTAYCSGVAPNSMYGLGPLSGAPCGGFLSDVVRVPYADHMLVAVPETVAAASVASLSDNIVDAWRTVAPQLEKEPGAAVLIVGGSGSIALYAVAIALAVGASRVDWIGGRGREHELAAGLGATVLATKIPDRADDRYPVTVDASANPAGLSCALRSTAPDGTCTSIGIYFAEQTPVPLLEMYMAGIHFSTGRVHARTAMPHALDLVRRKQLRPELITSRVASWEDAPDAMAEFSGKLVLTR